jgi:hypothetical protein
VSLRYLVLPGLPTPLRLALFGLAAAGGVFLQLALPGGFWPGTALLAAGLLLVFARGYRNKPVDLGFEDWKPVSLAELNRIRDNLQRTRAARVPLAYRRGFPLLVILPLAVLAFVFWAGEAAPLLLLVFDAILLLAPFLFSGKVRLWTPRELQMKMQAFQPLVDRASAMGGTLILTPYLRFDRDREGRQIPEDVRLMVEPRRKPADFLGVQLQVAINNGPNGPVPYLYAVFLCRGKGASFEGFRRTAPKGMIKEPGGDGEYGYVVLRQKTSGKGYHTTAKDCERLLQRVIEEIEGL